jgi:hypothetical protein
MIQRTGSIIYNGSAEIPNVLHPFAKKVSYMSLRTSLVPELTVDII